MNWVTEANARGYRVTPDGRLLNPSGRELKQQVHRDGYRWFRFAKKCPPVRVHRLQAFQKFGNDMFAPGIECRHLDGNRSNNSSSNIAIGTKSQNAMDKAPAVRMRAALNASRHVVKHSHAEVLAYLNSGHTYRQAMAHFGIKSKGTLFFIARKSMEARQDAAVRQHASLSHSRAVADLCAD